jgi:hypothetical protein
MKAQAALESVRPVEFQPEANRPALHVLASFRSKCRFQDVPGAGERKDIELAPAGFVQLHAEQFGQSPDV